MMTEAEVVESCAEIAGRVVKPDVLLVLHGPDCEQREYRGDRATDELLADYRAGLVEPRAIFAVGVMAGPDEDPTDHLMRLLERRQVMRDAGIDRTTRFTDGL